MPTPILEQNTVSNDTVIDLLDRQPFINQMLQIAEALSKNKKNACYALNGAWGVGKSFVINEFEKQIAQYGQQDTTLNRFLLFHYDCWKYDYYAEPLTAIISVMLDALKQDVHLLSDKTKTTILSTLKAIGIYALDHFDRRIERKFGFSPNEIYDAIVNTNSEVLAKIEESHEFDSYYAIKTTLNQLREAIAQLSKDQTILLVVDELDRCLPEYTIKVLERLHHVFENIPNVQIIIATDKKQLGHVIRQIYGEETSVTKYLEKFVQFELTLTAGRINDNFSRLFSSYTSQFTDISSEYSSHEFIEMIFENVDTRTRIAIINRCELLHSLLSDDCSNKTSGHMCAEIFLVMLKHYDLSLLAKNQWYSDALMLSSSNSNNYNRAGHTGLKKLNNIWLNHYSELVYSSPQFRSCNVRKIDGLILATYMYICGNHDFLWSSEPIDFHSGEFIRYISRFWNLLNVIH